MFTAEFRDSFHGSFDERGVGPSGNQTVKYQKLALNDFDCFFDQIVSDLNLHLLFLRLFTVFVRLLVK